MADLFIRPRIKNMWRFELGRP